MTGLNGLSLKELDETLARERSNLTEEARIGILQEMAKRLLNNYYIQVGDLTIEPLLIEAYYYDSAYFKDVAVHSANKSGVIAEQARKRQQGNFGKLYVHHPKFSGVDICVTDSNEYCLSFLIKNALVNGEWKTQEGVALALCNHCQQCAAVSECVYNDTVVLHPLDKAKNDTVVFLPRKGLSKGFANAPLAAVSLETIEQSMNVNLTLVQGYGKQWKCAMLALSKTEDEEAAREYAKILNNNAKIEDRFWQLAKESMERQKTV